MRRVWLATGFLVFSLLVSVPAFGKDASYQLAPQREDQERREEQQDQRKYPTSVEVQVGSERITVSGAQGFVEPTQAFPSLRELAERYVRPASHLLAVFLLEK